MILFLLTSAVAGWCMKLKEPIGRISEHNLLLTLGYERTREFRDCSWRGITPCCWTQGGTALQKYYEMNPALLKIHLMTLHNLPTCHTANMSLWNHEIVRHSPLCRRDGDIAILNIGNFKRELVHRDPGRGWKARLFTVKIGCRGI